MAIYKRSLTPLDLLSWTSFRRATSTVELSKRLALMISPILKEKALGLEITGAHCYLQNRVVREPDEDPYEVDVNENPMAHYHSELQLTILLPSSSFIAKFRQMIPSIEEALQRHGVVSLRVRWKVVPSAWKGIGR